MTVCFWTLSLTAGHDDPKRPIDGLAHRILGNMDICFVFVYQSDSVDYFLIEPVELPVEFPTPSKTIHKEALVRDRFFLNYCTYGYTMPWWKWPQWEWFIDWMALNGINMPLAIWSFSP